MTESDLAVRIEPVGGRIASVGSLLAETFAATPSPALAAVPYPRRVRLLRSLLTDATRDLARHGHVLVALGSTGSREKLRGALLLTPPGSLSAGLGRRLRSAPANLRAVALAPRAFPRWRRSTMARGQVLPTSDDWWLLHTLAVDRNAHRQGIGRALMERGLALIDQTGAPSYLHTTNRAMEALARRLGFIVDSVVPTTYPDEPPCLLMRRPGRGAT